MIFRLFMQVMCFSICPSANRKAWLKICLHPAFFLQIFSIFHMNMGIYVYMQVFIYCVSVLYSSICIWKKIKLQKRNNIQYNHTSKITPHETRQTHYARMHTLHATCELIH
ncbi:hypothetical protein CDL12_08155 [Handroanthus impetiginosus]|uniref:Uncharacterized protein n=1 Tax=Handroanthus impetiginosus TaxID=429701 RepID=A0A2G9HNP8_9LAMI|nr:hypothetical protein CDL12_08155 [Handroanthus impetiginosus]